MTIKSFKTIIQHHQGLINHDDDIIQGLKQTPKNLPAKYFYDDRGSALFEQICELPEYYPTRTEAWILSQFADEIAQITDKCELIELGSGSSTKTLTLLDAYQNKSNLFRYVPVDVSGGILKASVLKLQKKYPGLSVEGLVGTYEQALAILASTASQSATQGGMPSRMIFFLGSSIGNFTPQDSAYFLQQVSQSLNPDDYFLLGIDLQKPKDILEAAYNDNQGVTAAFNLNMLSHLNWRFQGNFDLDSFAHQAIYNQADAQIEMYLHCHKSHWVSLEALDLKVFLEAGESILTEISRKFDLDNIQQELEVQGLKTIKTWTDPKKWFALILCQA